MKKEIEILGKKVILMKQPASFILNLERECTEGGTVNVVKYARKILEYPKGQNLKLEEILILPEVLKMKDIEISLRDRDGNTNYNLAFEILMSSVVNGRNDYAFVAEFIIKKAGKLVDNYDFEELEVLGLEAFKTVVQTQELIKLRDTFRSIK